jgi:hypothetical protein
MNFQVTMDSQNGLEDRKVGGLMLPDLKVYYKITVIQNLWHCHKDSHT